MRDYRIDEHRNMTEKAREALIDSLAAVERESFSDPWSEKAFADSLANPIIKLMTLYEDGALLAYALFSVLSPEAELLDLAVRASARRQGAARELLASSRQTLTENGVSEVFLEVRESNAPARALYAKEGFVPIGRRKQYYRYPTEDAILMMLRLD